MRATAVRNCSPQSQRKLPSRSPVRHAECRRTGTAFAAIGLADHDRDVLGQAVLVAENGDLALDGIRERHACAAQQLQRMVAEARRLMHDVADGDRQYAGQRLAVVVEADQCRHESPGFRKLERSRGERCAARRRVDVECARRRRVRCRRRRRACASTQDPSRAGRSRQRRRSIGATTLRHAHAPRSRASRLGRCPRRRAARTARPAAFRWPRRRARAYRRLTCTARPRRSSSTARSNESAAGLPLIS